MWSPWTPTLHLLFILVSHCVLFQKSLDEEVQKLLSLKAEYKEKTGSDWKPGAPAVKTTESSGATANAEDLNEKIKAQGDKIRKLKADKADKLAVTSEVNALLKFKTEYKAVTGKDWSPEAQPTQPAPSTTTSADDLYRQIAEQGDKVRKLKTEKADKTSVTTEVNLLLKLKTEFKSVTGKDWTPNTIPTTPAKSESSAKSESPAKSSASDELSKKITEQGDKVRKLKEAKASKDEITPQVQLLLTLKKDYKEATGTEWKPATENKSSKESKVANSKEKPKATPVIVPPGNDILIQIAAQGDKVRGLKAAKASKNTIDEEVATLKTLKQNYKNITGEEWKPELKPVVPDSAPAGPASAKDKNSAAMDVKAQLTEQVNVQGNLVRDLKAAGKDKAEVDEAVKKLLALKEEYHAKTGEHFPAQGKLQMVSILDFFQDKIK